MDGFYTGPAGSTIDEAMLMAREAIELYIFTLVDDGREIPLPSEIESLRSNSQYRDAIWAVVAAEYTKNRPP